MLSINKTYCWLFVFAVLMQIPGAQFFKIADELLAALMLSVVALDVLINKQVKKYMMLWIVTAIILCYAIYSMLFMPYNTVGAIAQDVIAQIKPFCYFCISYAIVPHFNDKMKHWLKIACLLNIAILLIGLLTGTIKEFFHIASLGHVSILSFMVYTFASTDENGRVSKKDLIISLVILSVGLACTRAKFYGECVMALYMLFVYIPGFAKNIKITHIIAFLVCIVLVVFVAWDKIQYYFLANAVETGEIDEELLASFARPMLYAGMLMILAMHPILGSGLASFATNASSTAVNYSGLYSIIGLDEVWGLSPDYDSFICDAFYPSLAQFGIVGIALFIYFFVWIYKRLSLALYTQGKIPYSIGIMAIVVILIESIAATTFNQPAGALCMMLLGCITSSFNGISKEEINKIKEMPYKDTKAMNFIKQTI